MANKENPARDLVFDLELSRLAELDLTLKAYLVKFYSPDQERAEDGKWTDGGGGGSAGGERERNRSEREPGATHGGVAYEKQLARDDRALKDAIKWKVSRIKQLEKAADKEEKKSPGSLKAFELRTTAKREREGGEHLARRREYSKVFNVGPSTSQETINSWWASHPRPSPALKLSEDVDGADILVLLSAIGNSNQSRRVSTCH